MIQCTNCKVAYPEVATPYCCPNCGGIYDFEEIPPFDSRLIDASEPGIWRYKHVFGLPADAPVVSLGEGDTPLVWTDAFDKKIAFKLEYLNPTGSFKDRGTALLVSFLRSRDVDAAVEDSSGNAGASFAAYASRAGLKARVFVPGYASGPKRDQIAAFGAELVSVPGPRSNAAETVQRAADRGAVYASHAHLPQGLPGFATVAYELYEQLDRAPGTVITPAGQGSLLLGMARGFSALRDAGLISELPVMVGVQAAACAPLWALWQYGPSGVDNVSEGETHAEGVRIIQPQRSKAIMGAIESSKGLLIKIEEENILSGRDALAYQGFYVEPTSAIVWDALAQVVGEVPEPIVVILTGSGLKSS